MKPLTRYSVAGSLAAVLIVTTAVLPGLARRQDSAEEARRELEHEARFALRQVGYAVMGTKSESSTPVPVAPLTSSSMSVTTDQGACEFRVREGESGMELLRIEGGREQVLTSAVQPHWDGEVANGLDDNGNGLIDEPGFHFVRDGENTRIRLALARRHEGELLSTHVETTVSRRR